MWKDPIGLAPEKEKIGEELQFWEKKQTQSSPIDPGEEYWIFYETASGPQQYL